MNFHVKNRIGRGFLLLTAVFCMLLQTVCADNLPVESYTCTEDDPIVPAEEVFRLIYEKETDFSFTGPDGTSWYFFYENIFRSTEKWRDFSTKVSLTETFDPALGEALAGFDAVLLDFRDGDFYPGTAEVSVDIGSFVKEGETFAVYQYQAAGEGQPLLLQATAENCTLRADHRLVLTLTEAHDFLLVRTPDGRTPDLTSFLYRPSLPGKAFFGGLGIGWIIFFAAIGLVLTALVLYLIVIKILKKKRSRQKLLTAQQNKQIAGKKRR